MTGDLGTVVGWLALIVLLGVVCVFVLRAGEK